ncbi:MAG: hypothetical protein EBX59_07475 [Betaproteobacteria bacterium]|nr:hypothetical protein [Betaproteobacteria bacterium]
MSESQHPIGGELPLGACSAVQLILAIVTKQRGAPRAQALDGAQKEPMLPHAHKLRPNPHDPRVPYVPHDPRVQHDPNLFVEGWMRPIGPGRCAIRFPDQRSKHHNASCEADPTLWSLESWHMLDWMLSAQFRGPRGQPLRQHWLRHRMPETSWYRLRRWLVWSGRRVEAIGQRDRQSHQD